jgi:hypothetical protein
METRVIFTIASVLLFAVGGFAKSASEEKQQQFGESRA